MAPQAPTPTVERVLVVTAHPDDVDFGAGGSIASWTDAGIEVAYCICTSGEAGGFDEAMPRPAMAELRQEEQRAAGKVLGVTDLTFLGYPDGRLQSTIELRRDISRVIRRVRPQRVVCQSPDRIYQRIYASHPDHLAAGDAAISAVYPDARNPFAHPELLDEGWEPWAVTDMLMMAGPSADTYIDTTDTIDRKIEALRAHDSQHPDPESLDQRIRAWGAMTAQSAGLPEGTYAEGFLRIDTA
jgi:LmbE family N-acetylglucosaminyl deacetylase